MGELKFHFVLLKIWKTYTVQNSTVVYAKRERAKLETASFIIDELIDTLANRPVPESYSIMHTQHGPVLSGMMQIKISPGRNILPPIGIDDIQRKPLIKSE